MGFSTTGPWFVDPRFSNDMGNTVVYPTDSQSWVWRYNNLTSSFEQQFNTPSGLYPTSWFVYGNSYTNP
jgi:hypothetical protein